MFATMTATAGIALALVAAAGYAFATLGMKIASDQITPIALVAMGSGFAAAALAEIVLMRHADLSVLYVSIIAVESVMVLAYAFYIGEGLRGSQILGGGCVMVGMLLVFR